MEQVDSSVVENEEPPCEAIKQLAIGDIRLQENKATGVEPPQAEAATKTTAKAGAAVPLTLAEVLPSSTAAQRSSTTTTMQTAVANISQFMDKAYNPSLSKKKMKLKWKVNSRPISSATTKSSPKH